MQVHHPEVHTIQGGPAASVRAWTFCDRKGKQVQFCHTASHTHISSRISSASMWASSYLNSFPLKFAGGWARRSCRPAAQKGAQPARNDRWRCVDAGKMCFWVEVHRQSIKECRGELVALSGCWICVLGSEVPRDKGGLSLQPRGCTLTSKVRVVQGLSSSDAQIRVKLQHAPQQVYSLRVCKGTGGASARLSKKI
jgi:hypothetical protein